MKNNDRKRIQITPDLLWNRNSMLQELIFWGIAVIVYLIALVISLTSSHPGEGFTLWFSNVNNSFVDPAWYLSLVRGLAAGIMFSFIVLGLDALVGLTMNQPLKTWLARQDHLLPRTLQQKKWATGIALLGSSVEEILFRIFIFQALLPLWNSWLWAALIVSAFFTLLHTGIQGFWSTCWIFIISLALCFFLQKGQSIYFISFFHIAINLSNIFIMPFLLKSGESK